MAQCQQGFAAVFSALPFCNLYQVQCLAKPAAQGDLLFSSMTRTSSVTVSRRNFGSCTEASDVLHCWARTITLHGTDDVFVRRLARA